jgi:hypothetical protein
LIFSSQAHQKASWKFQGNLNTTGEKDNEQHKNIEFFPIIERPMAFLLLQNEDHKHPKRNN